MMSRGFGIFAIIFRFVEKGIDAGSQSSFVRGASGPAFIFYMFQRSLSRPADHFAAGFEAGTVAGAVPGLVSLIPADNASEVWTYGGEQAEPPFVVAVSGHLLALMADDSAFTLCHFREAFGPFANKPLNR
jgi:hypothetical protein